MQNTQCRLYLELGCCNACRHISLQLRHVGIQLHAGVGTRSMLSQC